MPTDCNQPLRSKRRRRVAVLLVCAVALMGLVVLRPPGADRLFRGKPESQWIKELKYSDTAQVKEWRAYGEEGVQVLIRGLEDATHPGQRAYRRFNRRLPASVQRWLPSPKPDSTQSTRECLVSLLWSLGNDAKSATPVMIRTVRSDESQSVRQSAIGYFISTAGKDCLLNQLPPNQKKALLPALIYAMEDPELRHNAAIVLKFYPEESDVVAPVLLKALQDPQPYVRLYAAEALNRVAADMARKAGATSILIALAKHSDDQIAAKAVAALGRSGSQLELAVPVLIECLQSTNTLIGCEAVWVLEWAPSEFNAQSEAILSALIVAAQRKDGVGGYASIALSKWKSRTK